MPSLAQTGREATAGPSTTTGPPLPRSRWGLERLPRLPALPPLPRSPLGGPGDLFFLLRTVVRLRFGAGGEELVQAQLRQAPEGSEGGGKLSVGPTPLTAALGPAARG